MRDCGRVPLLLYEIIQYFLFINKINRLGRSAMKYAFMSLTFRARKELAVRLLSRFVPRGRLIFNLIPFRDSSHAQVLPAQINEFGGKRIAFKYTEDNLRILLRNFGKPCKLLLIFKIIKTGRSADESFRF